MLVNVCACITLDAKSADEAEQTVNQVLRENISKFDDYDITDVEELGEDGAEV